MNRTAILMGRLHKLENLQSKIVNLLDGVVFGGELPEHVIKSLKTEKVRQKLKGKIKKAEMLKLKIAIAIYEDI
jgi:hypothetical protein